MHLHLDAYKFFLHGGLRPSLFNEGNNNSNMEIKAVKFRKDGFYTQPFVFGGEEGMDKFDHHIRYRGSLQNYLIDTGNEVILVDTGITAGTPEETPDETSKIFTGKDICTYMEAFAALGYKPEQVTKILLTHRHADHSGELRSFPNAKVYVNKDEMDAVELQGLTNLVPVSYTDGPYYNFPESQKIADGIYLIKAKGHTKGNSIIVVENDGLFYMLHGDITYVDEALYEDKLSVSSMTCRPLARRRTASASSCATIPRCIAAPTPRRATRTLKQSA